MSPESSGSPSRRVRWIARFGVWLVRLLGASWRVRTRNEGPWRRLRGEHQSFIFAFWHGQMLPLLYHHRNERITVLISEHGDGEIIARIATSLGYQTIRGSTSRGATRALVEMANAIERGTELAITPDGPRGPARSVAPGVMAVAQRTGVPIVPVGVSAERAWQLKSWDRFLIPQPFAHVRIVYGDPIMIDRASAREAVEEAPRVRELLLEMEQRARA